MAARYVLQLEWPVALLIGAILSSTDAAVFSVLRTVPLPRRLSGMLEAESGFNDAPVVISSWRSPRSRYHGRAPPVVVPPHRGRRRARGRYGHRTDGGLVRCLAASAGRRGVVGPVLHRGRQPGRPRVRVAAAASTSGFIAAYLSALVLGNLGLPHRSAVHSFSSALAPSPRSGCSCFSGCSPRPPSCLSRSSPPSSSGWSCLVARPLSVLVSLTPFRIPLRDQAFLSWAGLRGAVPIVLATVPATLGTPNAERIFDLVFVSSSSSRWSRARPCRGWRDGWGSPSRSARSSSTWRPPPWRRWARRSSR